MRRAIDHVQMHLAGIEYVLRDMTDASGGFYSTEDADSNGVEGEFYVWRPAELEEFATMFTRYMVGEEVA